MRDCLPTKHPPVKRLAVKEELGQINLAQYNKLLPPLLATIALQEAAARSQCFCARIAPEFSDFTCREVPFAYGEVP